MIDEEADADQNVFLVNFTECVEQNHSVDEALNLILEPGNEKFVLDSCFELVSCLGNRMGNGELFKRDVEAWCTLQNILDYIVKVCKPREILVALLQLLSQIGSDEFFDLLIKPLKVTFLRLPNKRTDSLLYTFDKLYDYVTSIEPDEMDQSLYQRYIETAEDKLLFENFHASQEGGPTSRSRVDSCVESLLNFLEPFVSEAQHCKRIESPERRRSYVQALAGALLKLLARPVAHFDVGKIARRARSERVTIVKRLIALLFDLTPNAYWKIYENWKNESEKEVESSAIDATQNLPTSASPISICVLSTFVFYYRIGLERLPLVYATPYVVQCLMPQAAHLLNPKSSDSRSSYCENDSCPNALVDDYGRLGLKLCKLVLRLVPEKSFSVQTFDQNYQVMFGLIQTTFQSQSLLMRQKSYGRFGKMWKLFQPEAQIVLIRMIFRFMKAIEDEEDEELVDIVRPLKNKPQLIEKDVRDFEVPQTCWTHYRGHVIDLFRQGLFQQLTTNKTSNCFVSNSPDLLKLFSMLKHQEETELLENFEQIMATLNLMLVVCFRIHNESVVVKLEPILTNWFATRKFDFKLLVERYTMILIEALKLTRLHLNLEESGREKSEEMNTLCKLDLINSVVARVGEMARSL